MLPYSEAAAQLQSRVAALQGDVAEARQLTGNRIVFERRDDFWADYPHWHEPQAKTIEILTVSDPAARFALLKSGQADIVYNLPWPLARGLARSPSPPGASAVERSWGSGAGRRPTTVRRGR